MKNYPWFIAILSLPGLNAAGQCGFQLVGQTIEDVTCYGGEDGSISVVIQGTATLNWLNVPPTQPLDMPQVTNLAADTYYLRALDAANCADTFGFTVSEPPQLVAVPNSVVVCPGSTVNLLQSVEGGVPGYSYDWISSTGSACYKCSSAELTVSVAQLVEVTVTDDNGCSVEESVSVGAHPAIQLTLDSIAETCGADGEITVNALGGVPPFDYRLNGGAYQSSSSFQMLQHGNYLVEVLDSEGCTEKNTIAVSDHTTDVGLQTQPTAVSCPGSSDGEVILLTEPGSSVAFSIDGNTFQQSPLFQNLSGGSYVAYVEDTNGCIHSQPVMLFEPQSVQLQTAHQDPSCFGSNNGTVLISTTGGSYPIVSYELDGNIQSTGIFAQVAAGTFNVVCTDSAGCTYTTSVTLTQPPAIVVDSASVTSASCYGSPDGGFEVTATGGTGGYQYSIDGTNFQSSPMFTNLVAGTYLVTIRDNSGCSETQQVIVNEPVELILTPLVSNASCYGSKDGDIIVLTSGGGIVADFSMDEEDWQTLNTFTGLAAGMYTIYAHDTNGCTFSTTAIISQPDEVEVTGSVTENGGLHDIALSVAGGNGGYTFAWSNGATTQDLTELSAGVYVVTVTDSLGCTGSTFFVIEGTGIGNLSEDHVFVYPNPANDLLYIEFLLTDVRLVELQLFNTLGQQVMAPAPRKIHQGTVELNIGSLSDGVYILRMTIGDESFTTMVMKQ